MKQSIAWNCEVLPMMDSRRRLLLSETELQCGFGLAAYRDATTAFQRRNPEEFWRSIQSLVTAAIQIRRLLIPEPEVRAILGLPDNSPLLGSELEAAADLAAAFQMWVRAHPRGPMRLSNFGPLGISHADPAVFGRYFDVDSSTLILYGTPIRLPDLLTAMAAVKAEATAQLRQLQTLV